MALAAPLVVAMLKAPHAGFVKTRLAREVGPEPAVAIYRVLVERQIFAIPDEWPVEVHVAPAEAVAEMRQWLGPRLTYHPQRGDGLGARLIHAVAGAFERAAGAVIVIGGDCPGLDERRLRQAWTALRSVDVVLGPALDGGYYLIGLRRPFPELFRDIAWSSSGVLGATRDRVERAGLSHVLLDAREDVDDLAGWRRAHAPGGPMATADSARSGGEGMDAERLTVIVPALNEAALLEGTLARVQVVLPRAQVVVVDGGSTDKTAAIAMRMGAVLVPSAAGRGIQCHAGALWAKSEWLLFLHADTLLPLEAESAIAGFAADSGAQIGTFRMRFSDGGRLLNAMAWVTSRGDSVFTRFGDQGILVRRSFYETLGGFPPWPLFEDVALLRKARKRTRIRWLPARVATSARRFHERGVLRQRLLNAELMLRYLAGASPFDLANRYQARDGRNPPGGVA